MSAPASRELNDQPETAPAASAPPVPNANPYKAKRYCLCKKEINLVSKQTRCKCSKCGWNFCDRDCRKRFKKDHAVNCEINHGFNVFFNANKTFLSIFGAWLKSRDDTDYIGMRIDIPDDPAADVRAVPFNKQSYDILLQKVHGSPDMYLAGYPDCFAVMIAWKGQMVCCELDLVKPTPDKDVRNVTNVGRVLLGDSPMFDDRNAGLFIVPPAGAAKGEKRDGWMKSWMENKERPVIYQEKPYTGFAMWLALNKQ